MAKSPLRLTSGRVGPNQGDGLDALQFLKHALPGLRDISNLVAALSARRGRQADAVQPGPLLLHRQLPQACGLHTDS